MRFRFLLLCAAPFLLAACASGSEPEYQRGWIGGDFRDVTAHSWDVRGAVYGMPEGVAAESAALVTAAYDGSPLAKAGLAPGDLVISADGVPVDGRLALREHVEAKAPGSKTTLSYWHDGEMKAVDVTVGRETYESAGMFQIALPLSLDLPLDLWPFDDGINVLSLLVVEWGEERTELASPEMTYRNAIDAGHEADAPRQESFHFFLVPIGFEKGKQVIRQESLP